MLRIGAEMWTRILLLGFTLVAVSLAYTCPPGWKSYKDNCYYISRRTMLLKNYQQAKTICNHLQSDLLYVESQDEMNWLEKELFSISRLEVIQQEWWTGLTDVENYNEWVWDVNNQSVRNTGYLPWAINYPNPHDPNSCQLKTCNRCALVATHLDFRPPSTKTVTLRGLVEQGCKVKNPYICKRANITETPSKCDYSDGWVHIDNMCWKVFRDTQKSYEEARQYCSGAENGRLATIHSQHQQEALMTISNDDFYEFWIGLQVNKSGTQIDGMWTDGSDLSHHKQPRFWADKQPNFDKTKRGCVYVNNVQFNINNWFLDSCYEDRSFVCQRPEGVCAAGWLTYNSRCYQVNFNNKLGWQQALDHCAADNSHLMEITTDDEHRLLRFSSFLYKYGIDALWLGFKNHKSSEGDQNGTNIWWTSRKIVENVTVIFPSDVNTDYTQDLCGIYYTDGSDGNLTLTANCAQLNTFICESDANDSTISYKPPPVTKYCDYDYFQFGSYCYKFNPTGKTWNEAQKACRDDDSARLASITDPQIQSFMNSYISVDYWIGLSTYGKSGRWIWQNGQRRDLYINMIPGYHKQMSASANNCIRMMGRPGRYKGMWVPQRCEDKNGYICEKPAMDKKPDPITTPVYDPDCGRGWVSVDNFCYKLKKERRVWAEAEGDCINEGAHLTGISSGYEQLNVQNLITKDMSGLSIWLGGSDKNTESAWKWVGGEVFSYVNWAGITTFTDTNLCIAMMVNSKRWETTFCARKKSYICKRNKPEKVTPPGSTQPTTTLKPGQTLGCNAGFDKIGENCYKFVNKTITHGAAHRACRGLNSNLATITSESQDKREIHNGYFFYGMSDKNVWIGLNDRDGDGKYTWEHQHAVTYVDWSHHQPADIQEKSRCVIMNKKAVRWQVWSCENEADGYICQHPLQPVAMTTPSDDISNLCPKYSIIMSDTTCYAITLAVSNFMSAKQSCEDKNMELIYFRDNLEETRLMKEYKRRGALKIWLNYKNYNGTYKVNDREVTRFEYIGEWNKNHTGNEFGKCVYLDITDGKWYDTDCSSIIGGYACKTVRFDYTPKLPEENKNCPSDTWRYVNGMCYRAFQSNYRPNKKTWFEARDECRMYGGDLASLHALDVKQMDEFKKIFSNKWGSTVSTQYWIGLNKLDLQKSHVWSDNSNFDFSAWEDGEPNLLNGHELCVVTYIQRLPPSGIQQYWLDKLCVTAHDYVCQVKPGTPLVTIPLTTTVKTTPYTGKKGDCDSGWYEFDNMCYKFKFESFSWHQAKADCLNKEYASLAVIHNLKTNNFITSMISKMAYSHFSIGLSKFGRNNWEWEDGSALDFTHWSENEPSNHGEAEMCAQIYNQAGFWNDYNCGKSSRGHICMSATNGVEPPLTTAIPIVDGYCQNGFKRHGDRCYGIFGIDSPLNFTSARDKCRTYGSGYDLTDIQDDRQNMYVTHLFMKNNVTGWIGLSDLSHSNQFFWSNNRHMSQTYWADGSPGYHAWQKDSVGRCARQTISRFNSMKWHIENCDLELPYLCSGLPDPAITTPTPEIQSKNCPVGYKEYKSQCYQAFKESPLNYRDAEQVCKNDGGHLVSILNVDEELFVASLIAYGGTYSTIFWTGLQRKIYQITPGLTVGQYEWNDGMPVTYTRWGRQTKHFEGTDYCATMEFHDGSWTSLQCDDLNFTLPFICKISGAVPPTHPPQRYICADSESQPYRDQCYRIFTSKYGKSFSNALQECFKLGMRLASVHDGNTNRFLLNSLQNSPKPKDVWLGLFRNNEGGYMWNDLSELEFENWAKREPKSQSGDMCGFLRTEDGSWSAERCYSSKGFICQNDAHSITLKPRTTPTTAPTTSPTTTILTTTQKQYCNDDRNWKYYNQSCYYVGNEDVTWHAAHDRCRSMGAELASLHGKDEIEFIFRDSYVSRYITAIGLTKLGTGNWAWTDRSLVDFTNWGKGEPNNHDGSERCVFMFSHRGFGSAATEQGRWNDVHCSTHGAFVCKRPEVIKHFTMRPAEKKKPGYCPINFHEFGNNCYGIFGLQEPRLNFTDARDSCRSMGKNSDLVTIPGVKEQAFLTSQLYVLEDNVWIGLSDRIWNNRFWWSDNKRVTYTNWVNGEPNLYGTHNCVEMLLHKQYPGKWSDEKCDVELPYICYMPKDQTIVTPPTTNPDNPCKSGWTYWYENCYKFNANPMSWLDASDYCTSQQSELVSITTAYEQALVESLTIFDDKPAWIGLYELVSPKLNDTYTRFMWRDDWPVAYTNWDNNRPIRAENGELKCTSMNPNTGRWNDTFCYFTYPFICKISEWIAPTTPTLRYSCDEDKGEFLVSDRCLYFSVDEKKSWSDAHLSCLQSGGELASLHKHDEHMTVMDHLYNIDKLENIWIGLVKNINGGFYWLDQSAVQYTNWAQHQPDNVHDSEDCVEIVYIWNGKWNDKKCSHENYFLCEKEAESLVPEKTTAISNTGGQTGDSAGKSNSGLIAGIVIPLLVIIAIICAAAFIVWKKKREGNAGGFGINTDLSTPRFYTNNNVDEGSLSFENRIYEPTEQDQINPPINQVPIIHSS